MATDAIEVYKVTLNAVEYPTGFNDVDYICTEVVEDELFRYTFSSLVAGQYIFAITATDGANTDVEYLPIVVRAVVVAPLSVTEQISFSDDWINVYYITNRANGTFYVWDNTTLVGGSNEGWYQIAKPTVNGLHNYTILINTTQGSIDSSSQTMDNSVNDAWAWKTFQYTVNPITFSITNLIMMQNNESIIVQGFWHTPNTTLTWIAYEGNVEIDSGVLTLTASGEYNAIYWMKNEPTTFNNLTLSITADGSTINLHSYSYILDSATYIVNVAGSPQIYEGDEYLDESITYEGIQPEDMAVVVMELTLLVFLTVILTAVITWRDGRNKRREDYLAQVASGGYP